MNIKVKMPRLKSKGKNPSLGKELLMSVIGTTISIVLTFGTALLIEKHQCKAEGRDVAMMVIHDIDSFAEHFRTLAKEEVTNHDLAMKVLERLDDIESIPLDTIVKVLDYLTFEEGNDFRYDESIEKTFQSNQEIWRSIDSPTFIDEARSFFHDRRMTYQTLNTSSTFRRPVNQDELLKLYATSIKTGKTSDWNGFLREKLNDDDVLIYLELYVQRQKYLNTIADQYQDMCNRCKFIMEITDEELEAFLAKRKQTGEPLTDSKLIGRWKTMGDEPQTYEFNHDHTFKQIVEQVGMSSIYQGRLKVIYTVTGRWTIKGDTLYRYLDAGCDIKIDKSGITYSPKMRDSVEKILKQYELNAASSIENMKKQQQEVLVRGAAIDHSGNKVELSYPENSTEGRVSYMVRIK